MNEQEIRVKALECASRIIVTDTKSVHRFWSDKVIEASKEFEKYIREPHGENET